MKFKRKSTKSDHVLIVQHAFNPKGIYYEIIPSSDKYDEFDIPKAYIHSVIDENKKNFLSDIKDETSYIVFHLNWKTFKSSKIDPKTGQPYMNTTIIDWELMEEDS